MEYKSQFTHDIKGLIQYKRSLGFSYVTNEYRLKQFDNFCCIYFPNEHKLTKSLAMEWLKRRTDESESNLSKRMEALRQLGKYMNLQEIKAFTIPTFYQPKVPRYQPHIFSDNELIAFFNATDICKINKSYPVRHLVYPVLFRLIYCCGLRLSEASCLLRKDIDTISETVYIINSKNGKDRLIVMSEDMSALCLRYDCLIDEIYPDRLWFFPSSKEKHYCKSSIDYAFRYFWNLTGISGSGNLPRVHDLRHQYCITRINTWLRDGKEIQSLLPYLSSYMGHSSLKETDYYLRLVLESFSVITDKTVADFNSVVPEVEY